MKSNSLNYFLMIALKCAMLIVFLYAYLINALNYKHFLKNFKNVHGGFRISIDFCLYLHNLILFFNFWHCALIQKCYRKNKILFYKQKLSSHEEKVNIRLYMQILFDQLEVTLYFFLPLSVMFFMGLKCDFASKPGT